MRNEAVVGDEAAFTPYLLNEVALHLNVTSVFSESHAVQGLPDAQAIDYLGVRQVRIEFHVETTSFFYGVVVHEGELLVRFLISTLVPMEHAHLRVPVVTNGYYVFC